MVKWPSRETDHSCPISASVKSVWSYPSSPPMPLWFAQMKTLRGRVLNMGQSNVAVKKKSCANRPCYDSMETGLLRHTQYEFYHYRGNTGVTQSTQALSKQRKIGNHGKEMWLTHSVAPHPHTKLCLREGNPVTIIALTFRRRNYFFKF